MRPKKCAIRQQSYEVLAKGKLYTLKVAGVDVCGLLLLLLLLFGIVLIVRAKQPADEDKSDVDRS